MADRCELCFANRRKLYQPWIDLRERNRDGVRRGVWAQNADLHELKEKTDWQACHRIIKAGLVFLCFVNVCAVLGGMPEQDRGEGVDWVWESMAAWSESLLARQHIRSIRSWSSKIKWAARWRTPNVHQKMLLWPTENSVVAMRGNSIVYQGSRS